MLDIIDAEEIEIVVDQFGKTWININGVCAVRVGHSKRISSDDPVRGFDIVYQSESNKETDDG